MIALQTAFNHARSVFGIEIPDLNWEIWGGYTLPYKKKELNFPGAYYVISIENDDAQRLKHNFSLTDGVTVVKAVQEKNKPTTAYLILHVATFYARESLSYPKNGTVFDLLLG